MSYDAFSVFMFIFLFGYIKFKYVWTVNLLELFEFA